MVGVASEGYVGTRRRIRLCVSQTGQGVLLHRSIPGTCQHDTIVITNYFSWGLSPVACNITLISMYLYFRCN